MLGVDGRHGREPPDQCQASQEAAMACCSGLEAGNQVTGLLAMDQTSALQASV